MKAGKYIAFGTLNKNWVGNESLPVIGRWRMNESWPAIAGLKVNASAPINET